MKHVIGVDIGGTNIRAGIVSSGRVIKKAELPTQAKQGKKTVVKNILEVIDEIFDKSVKGIGIGVAGSLDLEKGIVKNAPNLPLQGVNLKKIVRKKFRVPVFVDNDTNCFTLAEVLYGAGRGYSNVVGLTLGTGIGGGIVNNKTLYYGKGNAGELGHIIINFDGPKCGCGGKGHIESYLGAVGVKKLTDLTPIQLYGKALTGDRKAIKGFEDYGFYLGLGICNITSAFDPDVVIIGGRIANAWRFFSKSMISTVKKMAYNKGAKIFKAELEEPGIIGAACLVK